MSKTSDVYLTPQEREVRETLGARINSFNVCCFMDPPNYPYQNYTQQKIRLHIYIYIYIYLGTMVAHSS